MRFGEAVRLARARVERQLGARRLRSHGPRGFVRAVTAALLLGGCSLFQQERVAVVEETPLERACRAEARRAPEVRALWAQANPAVTPNTERLAGERRIEINDAFIACLRRAGEVVPGGVEAARPR